LSEPFVRFKVEGLSIGGDARPSSCGDIGYVIMTRKPSPEDEKSEVSPSETVMKWYHENIVLPFAESRRCEGDTETVLKLDSEVSMLNYLQRPEVTAKNMNKGITILVKIGGACTESSQALDCGDCFKELSSQYAQLTSKGFTSKLKQKFTKMLEESDKFLCKSKARKSAIIDTVAVTPEAYENALKSKKIKGGFGFSGDITRINSYKFLDCPDLFAM
jgi:hypothetical protein